MEPKKRGRPPGTTKGRVKIGTIISQENFDWLMEQRRNGQSIARIIDLALDLVRVAKQK